MNRRSVGAQTLKDLLGRPQEEIRNLLLKTGRKLGKIVTYSYMGRKVFKLGV